MKDLGKLNMVLVF